MKSQLGYLDVVSKLNVILGIRNDIKAIFFLVPPDIVDYQTSHDMVVEEEQNVTLICTAVGLPEPSIEWRREGKKPLLSTGSEESKQYHRKNYHLLLIPGTP